MKRYSSEGLIFARQQRLKLDNSVTMKSEIKTERWSAERVEVEEAFASSSQTSASPQTAKVSMIDLFFALVEAKKNIAFSGLTCAMIACVIVFILPNRYTAVTVLLPPQQNQSLSYALLSQVTGAGALANFAGRDLGLKNPNDLYVALLQSRAVEDPLISHFDLMKVYKNRYLSDTRKKLENNTDVQASKDGLIRVAVEDKDPDRAAAIANYYAEQLQRVSSTIALTEAGQRRLFFDHQLEGVKNQLAEAEVALKETQQKTGLIQLDSQSKALIEAVGRIRAEVASKEIELHTLEAFATPENPQYILVQRELGGLRNQLAAMEKQQTGPIGDVQVPVQKVPEVGLEYVRRLRDVKYYETLFEFIAKQSEAAKLDEARQGAFIQIVDVALKPDKRSSPKRLLIISICGLLGIIFATLGIFITEAWKRLPLTNDQRQRSDGIFSSFNVLKRLKTRL